MSKEIENKDFFTQCVCVEKSDLHSWEYCKILCENKKVLHIGCSDFPIFNKDGNLHIYLGGIAKELHGCDIHGIEELRESFDGVYYNSIDEVLSSGENFDVILVPNIIEHLKNPGEMVDKLFQIKFDRMFVLVPNYIVSEQSKYEDGIFEERIHPDHYAWYSPYTLWNLFKEQGYKHKAICDMKFFDNKNMISILITT